MTTKLIRAFVLSTLFLGQEAIPAENACVPEPIIAGFFNGVWNTTSDAYGGRNALKAIVGVQTPAGRAIRWEVFYNNTTSKWADLVETFDQKASQEPEIVGNRWELFWEAVSQQGVNEGWTSKISAIGPTLQNLFLSLVRDMAAQTVSAITFTLQNPPTLDDAEEQKALVDNYIGTNKQFLFIAHSQGNLFLVPTYDYAVAQVGPSAVGGVHIAPATGILRGEYTLANLDLVIRALNLAGTVLTPNVDIPPISLRPAPVDESGHLLQDTYLNPQMRPVAKIKMQAQGVLNQFDATLLQGCPVPLSSGFITYLPKTMAGGITSVSKCLPTGSAGIVAVDEQGPSSFRVERNIHIGKGSYAADTICCGVKPGRRPPGGLGLDAAANRETLAKGLSAQAFRASKPDGRGRLAPFPLAGRAGGWVGTALPSVAHCECCVPHETA